MTSSEIWFYFQAYDILTCNLSLSVSNNMKSENLHDLSVKFSHTDKSLNENSENIDQKSFDFTHLNLISPMILAG